MKKKPKKIATWTNELLVHEDLVSNKIKNGFTSRIVNYYNGGEDKIGDGYEPDMDDFIVEGFKHYPAKHQYGFHTGNRKKLNKYFGDFKIIDKRAKPSMSKLACNKLKINKSFSLKPIQKDIVKQWLKKKNGVIKAPARTGKCIVGSSLVLSNKGLVPIGYLCRKCVKEDSTNNIYIDIVNYKSEAESSTIAYKGYNSSTIKITSSYGYNVRGTYVHPVLVLRDTAQWVKLKDIREGDLVAINFGADVWSKTYVTLPDKLKCVVSQQLAYFMGMVVRNGNILNNNISISSLGSDYVLFKSLANFLFFEYNIVFKEDESHFHSPEVCKLLYSLGVSCKSFVERKIPWSILQSPKNVVVSFLDALLELRKEREEIVFIRTNKKLINEIQIVLANFGIISKVSKVESFWVLKVPYKAVKSVLLDNKPYTDFLPTEHKIEDNILWDKVSFIKTYSKKSRVYDLVVPETHSFVANSMVVHNTVIMNYIATKLKVKTLILANQNDLLKQWKKEFSMVTNVDKIATEKRPIIGFLNKWSDIDKYDIVLATWQKWNINPKKLRKYRDYFGLVLVDEVHRCNADCPKNVVANFSSKYKGGVTATVERKDGKELYMKSIIGPVTAVGEPQQMKCKVCFVKTEVAWPNFKNWTTLINRLCENKRRNDIIVSLAVKLAKQGKYVVIGSDRTKHILELTKRINKCGIKAAAFWGAANRDKVLSRAASGKVKVVVANRSMLTGINIPIWDTYLNILPLNNDPTYYQQYSRIRTMIPTKKEAIIYDFQDDNGISMGLANKRRKQYDKEDFIYLPYLNGRLGRINEEKEAEKSEYVTFSKVKASRYGIKPFVPSRKDGVSLASIFKK